MVQVKEQLYTQKKLVILLFVIIVTMITAACAKPKNEVQLEEIKDVANIDADISLHGKIEFVNWVTEDPTFIPEVVKRFNKDYPNIEVEITTLPFTEVRENIIARHAAGVSGDVYQLNMPWADELVDLGVLEPLDEFMKDEASFAPLDLVQEPMQKINGQTYMVPLTVMHFVLFCNTDHFEAAGIELPVTWEELAEAAMQLTDVSEGRYGLSISMASSGASNGPVLALYPLLYSAGGRTIKGGKPNINSPEVLSMMTFIDDLYDTGSISPGTLTKNGTQVIDDFAVGLASMMIQPSVHITNLKNREDSNINFDIVRVPGPEANNVEATRLHGFELGISSGSKNKDLAWTFVDWMTRAENNGWIAQQVGQMPANLQADTSFIEEDPILKKTYEMMYDLELVEELMLTPKSTDTWRIFTDYTQKMFLDELTPIEAVEGIQQTWEQLFEE